MRGPLAEELAEPFPGEYWRGERSFRILSGWFYHTKKRGTLKVREVVETPILE